jgi:ribosomal protein L7/L12
MPKLTYMDLMSIVTEYVPDEPVVRADALIVAILEWQEQSATLDPKAALIQDGNVFEWLQDFAIEDTDVMSLLVADKKIHAIKALRVKTDCSLKDAKDAVESKLVATAVQGQQELQAEANMEGAALS